MMQWRRAGRAKFWFLADGDLGFRGAFTDQNSMDYDMRFKILWNMGYGLGFHGLWQMVLGYICAMVCPVSRQDGLYRRKTKEQE